MNTPSTDWFLMEVQGEEKEINRNIFTCCVSNNYLILGSADKSTPSTNPLFSLNAEFSTLKFQELKDQKIVFSLKRLGKEYHFKSVLAATPDIY